MSLTIQLFGQFIEMAGTNTLQVEGVQDTNELRRSLENRFHQLQGIPYLVAVNKDIVSGNMPLEPGAVIALMPPYSGG